MSFSKQSFEPNALSRSSKECKVSQRDKSKRNRQDASNSPTKDPASAKSSASEVCKKRRRFPHIEGNFATMVFIPIQFAQHQMNVLTNLIHKIQTQFTDVESLLEEDLHISLSKTFTILFHEKESLLPILTKQLKSFKKFEVRFGRLTVLLNEDHSRTFISLEFCLGKQRVISMTRAIDQVMLLHKKETFYADPCPHVSIGWIQGDQSEALLEFLSKVDCQEFEKWSEEIRLVICRIGRIDHPVWT